MLNLSGMPIQIKVWRMMNPKRCRGNVYYISFKNFPPAPNESLDKDYDRFQKLISQLEVHAAPISKEDINQKFLRSHPPSWSQIALIMRNKPDIDQTDIDDLYNNLRVYEDKMKRSSSSTSNSQNLAFLSSKNTSSTNEVSTASGNFRVNTAGGTNSSSQVSSTLGADEVVCSFFAQQITSPPLDNEDLQQIDQDDLEELDIRWQVAMLTVRLSATTITGKGILLRNSNQEGTKGKDLMVIMAGGMQQQMNIYHQAISCFRGVWRYDWSNDFDEPVKYALMAHLSQAFKFFLNEVRSSDEDITPTIDRFSKADGYHVIPPLITWNFLIPRADISFAGLDEYAIRKKIIESKTTELNTDTSKSKTSETVGKTNKVNIEKPKSVYESVVPKPKINRYKVIIEDWYSDDEDDVSEVGTVSPSTDHLIKDYDFYAKKSPEPKLKTVVNTSQRVVKPVWDNAKRVNHQKISNKLKYPQVRRTFVPLGVLTRTGLVNPVRPNGKRAVHIVSTPRPISTARPISTVRPVSTARPFASKTTQTGSAIRPIYPRMDNGNPEISLQDHAVVDSGCSSHMTGNKAYLSDYEDYNGGFVAFGSDPKGGKITGKGKIRTANLDFDDVYFVNELNFKLLAENQVILKAPRQIGVYSLDLKNIVPSGDITCLYANTTTDESKLWHKRLGHVNFKNINKLVVKNHLSSVCLDPI
ncbi:ribonuclease H-like domain-containing protein [Tanacetum coccineum]